MKNNLNIVVAGLGTIGSSTIRLIEKNQKILSYRSGLNINIIGIFAKNKFKKRNFDHKKYKWFEDPIKMIKQKQVDTVLELIGGDKGIAKKICYEALKNSKNLITANKALIAKEGHELAKLAEQNKVSVRCEASVAGGIPIISTLKNNFIGVKINKITGILNGTCNYILTNMLDEKNEFNDSLKKAQNLGYAEQHPNDDLNGLDTLFKISILSTIAFNSKINLNKISYFGIQNITKEDVFFADRLGFRIKLLGICYKDKGKLKLLVSPFLISKKKELSSVNRNHNAIIIESNDKNKNILLGEGAGGDATSISVLSDLTSLSCNKKSEYMFGISYKKLKKIQTSDKIESNDLFFIRAKVLDRPGAIAAITTILKNYKISIKSLFQEQLNKNLFNVVILTHRTKEKSINLATLKLNKCIFLKGNAMILSVLDV